MEVDLFDFNLPEELIAQTPLPDRSKSRLMVLDRETGKITDEKFENILDYFQKGDCLVLNDTKVLPARLFGIKEDTGAKVEVLLLKQRSDNEWESLIKPARRVPVGTILQFGDGLLQAECVGISVQGGRILKFTYDGIFYEIIDKLGEMPLPPYIKAQLEERDRYQTVYAKRRGSAAAPTAGLHFTEDMLNKIRARGVQVVFITLHVGLGTFRPVSVDKVLDHDMHAEYFEMSRETATVLNKALLSDSRIITVGTTSTRTLETIAANNNGAFSECSGWTDIFIYPGYEFKSVSGMLTNFHLPKSTLIMLISAFAGRESVLKAYDHAIAEKYRFFSFGDAMLIV